jgi:N-methylhydantoinase B/oxoprolinase/acetone carboxylase alpha subunit
MGWSWRSRTDRPAQSKSWRPSTAPNSRRAGGTGGRSGKPGYLGLKSAGKQLEGKGLQEIRAGEHLLLHTPGGGGLGDPRHRDAAMIAADLENGLISPDSARADYGVEQESSDVDID